uniref:Uncharacterized protein LOC116945226 n=1 Tax=Petromyzon marinus TaxID=7757 RepID=A0AAJ7TCQ2_PETMA|nr:uncharacterized protein LOC116945226 [Petromyzon marinus]XP_032815425.1 uncharacterized protein LOC116945226 [Petromyzon marinus]
MMLFSRSCRAVALLLLCVPWAVSHISGDGDNDAGSGSGLEVLPSVWLQSQAVAPPPPRPLITPRRSLNHDGPTTTPATTPKATTSTTTTSSTITTTGHASRHQRTDKSASVVPPGREDHRSEPTLITDSAEVFGSGSGSGSDRCGISFAIEAVGPARPVADECRPATRQEVDRVRRVVSEYGRVLSSVRDTVLAEAGEHGSFAGALRASLSALRGEHGELQRGVVRVEAAFEGGAGDTLKERDAVGKAAARMRVSLAEMSDSLLKATRLHASLEGALRGLHDSTRDHGERLARLQGARMHGVWADRGAS